ncbi:sterol 3-beta-glucosyltransferase UGT80B1 isoform X2 [Diospyros lotus]|uniref:sterol 3-beta-glucosyltransferase UGT80B1 isoform X2 n=1 Tax=Diospyros lotus TaxID=55363 RepID=UPI002257D456|nr:sterol 3-beta-glucosyltransferase UGT80B1 isoform X2 [Diospyros lotus]
MDVHENAIFQNDLRSSGQTLGIEASAETEKNFGNECFDASALNGAEHKRAGAYVVGKENRYSGEHLDKRFTHGLDYRRQNPLQRSSVLEISQSKELAISHSPRTWRGLDHCVTAPVGAHRNFFLASHEMAFSRSMTEKADTPRPDLKFDRLSQLEKKNLIVNLVKIQNDGRVEVDLTKTAPVASELLELRSLEGSHQCMNYITAESNKSVPKLKIAMLVVGTRGDVQTFLAVAKRLQEFGHHVRLATHANFSDFVKSAGVEFYPLGGDPRVLAGYMARNKGLIPSSRGEISTQRTQLKAIIESLLPACIGPDIETGQPFSAQAIIANPPAYVFMSQPEGFVSPHFPSHVCRLKKLLEHGIQNLVLDYKDMHMLLKLLIYPFTYSSQCLGRRPTYEFPHPLARAPQAGYWLSYIVVDLLVWWGIRGFINDFRKRKLRLAPIAYFSLYHGSIAHLPTAYMWSPHVVPKPSDWGPLVDVVGYCFLNLGSKYQPPEEFVHWIQKGPPPIYIGFGSMPLEDPKRTTDIILEALKNTGQRGIIDRGWGDLGAFPEIPETVFCLADCPHDWLFPQCLAVVHHGGAGTTATGLRAGCPTTVVPFFGDQFFWGDRIYQGGLGPAPIPISQLTVEALSDAITFMLQPEVKSKAMEIGKLIENEDGVAAAVDAFHRHLPPEMPLPRSLSQEDDQPDFLQWFFLQIGRICCLPCGS